MDQEHFDDLTRTITVDTSSRRAALRLLTGGALGAVAARVGFSESANAKRNKKKKKKPSPRCGGSLPLQCPPPIGAPDEICYPTGTHCCSSAEGGGACYVGDDCCPPGPGTPNGSCALENEVCCSVAAGGGACSMSSPICCPPSRFEPQGSCIPLGNKCCPQGGYCGANETCCPPTQADPYGFCAWPGYSCAESLAARGAERRLTPVRRTEAASRTGYRRLTTAAPAATGK
jgi:hypothetical protein